MNTTTENIQSTQNNFLYDVIISGAGPVGLFLACELALAKCSVLILEKTEDANSPLKKVPFGIRGLSSPTIEALYRRGLLNQLELHKRIKSPHQNSGQGARRQVGHFAGIPFHEGTVDISQWKFRLQNSTPASLISEMQEIETILTRRAEESGVIIKRGFAINNFRQTNDEVTVESNNHSFKSKWLVGCDGSRSIVRKIGGFDFAGTEPAFTGYTTMVDIADPEKLKPGRNLTASGMYLQSQPGYVMIQDFDGGAFHSTDKPITLAHVQEVLRRVSNTDVTLTKLHVATTWTDRARQATTYRKGRVFLAGDAAHIHSPLGGQGLNLGLGDAMNLGWKLAATINKKAPENLLDTFYDERYPIGAQVLDWSRAQVAIMGTEPYARALHAIIRDLMETRDGATYFASRVWGINTHYNLGDDHFFVGKSVPNFELEDGSAIGELMHSGKGLLIDFNSTQILKSIADVYKDRIVYINKKAKEQFRLTALLVRPDGYIAWASNETPEEDAINKTMLRWFGKP
jgi:2-polyprenyl-6-methoxyphenol hydroxylase-like FAD-dependent oxidoreductase